MMTFLTIGTGRSALMAALIGLIISGAAQAVPRRIIIARHGEKDDSYALCLQGQERSLALRNQWLGPLGPQGQKRSLALRDQWLGRLARSKELLAGQQPVAFLAITPHTLETVAPSARSWSMPVVMFSEVPQPGQSTADKRRIQHERTREAAAWVLSDPTVANGVVVMLWEHRTIANQQLAERYAERPVTLRQLLNLDRLQGVPETWPDDTYGWFWVIDYANAPSPIPTAFRMVQETFQPPYANIKTPDWGDPVPQAPDCQP